MAGCMIPRTALSWDERVLAISGDKINLIKAKKGMFGQKVSLEKSGLISEIIGGEPFTIGTQQRFSIKFKFASLDFDITGGMMPVVEKFLDALGLKK